MEPTLQDTIALLTHTPAAFNALLRNLPETWTLRNEGSVADTESWTAFRVIGHLIYCEHVNWMPRVHWILQYGDTQPFPPFERAATPGNSLPGQLDEFARLRAENLADLEALHLTPENLTLHGQHPGLGPVTISELLATWATHDMTHLHQVTRILAYQSRNSVGPWSKYLGVLHCNGHSVTD
ncbi:MAG TPA: DinB family protein [Acidobacteriaceae bacterium]|jgi:hypothetical protein|nr:DinB family protein [Acidobacteriaceae bacterium]